jgi:hypothetical protein
VNRYGDDMPEINDWKWRVPSKRGLNPARRKKDTSADNL